MATTQIIRIGDRFEIANSYNSEIPEWPVQDAGGHWHHRQFRGQRVVFDRANVEFGFRVRPMTEAEVLTIFADDLPPNVYMVDNDNRLYVSK